MKRFLVILLALGLVVAFSAPAAATDVKFSGSYYVTGYYHDNYSLQDDSAANSSCKAYYGQRFRVNTVFQVAEGLKLTTRFDAMERMWGDAGTTGTTATSKNLSWERVYVSFAVPVGTVSVGYMPAGSWGTLFADGATSMPRIKFVNKTGPWTFLALIEKGSENDMSATHSDLDYDKYALAFINKWDQGQAGVLWFYLHDKSVATEDLRRNLVMPYFKATVGPVYLEGELDYIFGTKEYDAATPDMDYEGLSLYLFANVNLEQFYVGGQFAYVSGNDPTTLNDNEGGFSGADYNPCLILWNEKSTKWAGANMGTYGTTGNTMTNAYLYQVFAGMKPMPKLNVKASYTMAVADEKPTNYVDDDYGSEFDITATYKIYDNLSYMVGFGYLWTGDYYKGTNAANQVDDNYLVINKLTLKF